MYDENRLEKIEIKLAYLEDFLKSLQTVVLDAAGRIRKLEAEGEAVKARLLRLDDEEVPNRKPPHY